QPAAAIDADAERAHANGRLHCALHGATEGNAALELLGDALSDQRRVDLRFAHLDDIEMHLGVGHRGNLAAELLAARALLADQDPRPRAMRGYTAFLVWSLHYRLGDARLLARLQDMIAHLQVFGQQARIFAARRIPTRVPGAVNAEPKPD